MKRFTETNKWSDPWFRQLSPDLKCFWQWLCDNCDCAGVIEPDMELARFQVGATKPLPSPLQAFGDRVKMRGGKVMILKFVSFQYGDKLNDSNAAHRGVLKRIEAFESSPLVGAMEGLPSPTGTRIGVGVGKGIGEGIGKSAEKGKGTLDELKSYAVEIGLPESDGEYMFDHWTSNGWKNGSSVSKDWKAGMRKWKSSGWMPSQKNPQTVIPESDPALESISKRIMGLSPGWGLPLATNETRAISDRMNVLAALTVDQWETIKAYLSARLPEGTPGWQPKSRLKFIESAADVWSYAEQWGRKNGRGRIQNDLI